MLAELDAVMASLGSVRHPADIRTAILEENILGKATRSGRLNTATKLIHLYSFDPKQTLFSGFTQLWRDASASRPVLAVLLALCRDKVLQVSAQTILAAPVGAAVTKEQFYRMLLAGFAAKYSETTLQSTTRNVASSWRQSGHLQGEKPMVRTKAPADSHTLAFAVLIAYLRGLRGEALLASDWVRLLDLDPSELEVATMDAHQRGMITSRRIGSVIELTPGPGVLGWEAA